MLPETAAYTLAPDWVCEILSPSTAADDRALEMPFYAQAGIGHLWIVDPLLFTLEVYRLDAGTWRQLGVWRDEAIVQAEPFDARPLKLARLGPAQAAAARRSGLTRLLGSRARRPAMQDVGVPSVPRRRVCDPPSRR